MTRAYDSSAPVLGPVIRTRRGDGRKMTAGFASTMARVVSALVERWQNHPEGSVIETKSEMSRVALEALLGCIFSGVIGAPKAVGDATTRYYRTGGGLDPFDIIGLPDFIPQPNAPFDMLGAMLAAEDPETGVRLSETEVKDNVMTFF